MPTLAGWITGEQVSAEIIDQLLTAMSAVLERHGGQPARTISPGAGLIAFADTAYAMQRNDEPPVLDWVPDRRTLVYRRPLSGAHALYYIENWPAEGNLLFASEIKALLAAGVPRHLSLPALDALHRYGFIPAPLTAFQDIQVVPAGSILRWQHTKLVVNASTEYRLDETLTAADIHEQLFEQLRHVSAGLLPPHEQLIALTDGAAPSVLATTLAGQNSELPFLLASFGYKQGRGQKYWHALEQVAASCQHPFLSVAGVDQLAYWQAALTELEAPATDTLPLALHQLMHTVAAETGARVAVTGLGAAYLLAAFQFPTLLEAGTAGTDDILTRYRRSLTTESSLPLWSRETQERMSRENAWETTHHARKLAFKAASYQTAAQAHYYLDLHLRLPDYQTGQAFQIATQERIALRSPYLHHDILALLSRLPAQLANGTPRELVLTQLLRHHFPHIATAHAPLALRLPMQALFQSGKDELFQQTLSPEALRATGLFDAESVKKLLKQKQVCRELIFVFTTQLFYRMFGIEDFKTRG